MGFNMRRLFVCLAGAAVLCLLLSGPAYAADGFSWRDSNMLPDADTTLYESCEFGNFAADALRAAGQTEVALVDNGNLLRLAAEDNIPIAVGELTEPALRSLLESGLAGVRTDSETETVESTAEELTAFLRVSGLCVRYDATAPAGERVMTMENASGAKIDGTVSVTAPETLLKEAMIPCERLPVRGDQLLDEYYAVWLDEGDAFGRRVQILGTVDGNIVAGFPRWAVIAIPLLTCLLIGQALGRNKNWKDAHGVFLKRSR